MPIIKVVLLDKYSGKKTFSERLNQFLTSKIDPENWKWPISDNPQAKGLTRYQIILEKGSFRCKNLLNFTFITEKFQDCHRTKKKYGPFGDLVF